MMCHGMLTHCVIHLGGERALATAPAAADADAASDAAAAASDAAAAAAILSCSSPQLLILRT